MPFTPFHLGPGLLIGLLLLGHLDLPTFLSANIIIDLEPLLVLSLNLNYPVHGFFHSFIGGIVAAILLAYFMSKTRGFFSPLLALMKMEQEYSTKKILLSSVMGIWLHIILDSRLYSDIRPFFPSSFNPFLSYSMSAASEVIWFCILSFILGGIIYFLRIGKKKGF